MKLVLFEVDSVKVNSVVALSEQTGSRIVFIERFDDFQFKGSNTLVLSTVSNMGNLIIIGVILYGDSDDLLKCLIAARAELCNNDTITNPVFFCEPDPSIAVACFKAFILRE